MYALYLFLLHSIILNSIYDAFIFLLLLKSIQSYWGSFLKITYGYIFPYFRILWNTTVFQNTINYIAYFVKAYVLLLGKSVGFDLLDKTVSLYSSNIDIE